MRRNHVHILISYIYSLQVSNFPEFREPMRKREWTFSKFVDEFKSTKGKPDEFLYYQDALTDTVGSSIKHDFMHFNWRWVNDRKKRYNWGQLTSNLLLISQPSNRTPCHYDEQHNFFCQVMFLSVKILFKQQFNSSDYIQVCFWYCLEENTVDLEITCNSTNLMLVP